MDAVELLRTPWADRLHELCGSVRRELRVCAPFVKRTATAGLLNALPVGVDVRLVSCFNAAHFHRRYSDTTAFRDVLDRGGRVRNCQRLHAKLYLFDERAVVVTSANLTGAGLLRNWEYGVVLRQPELVSEIAEDFEGLWSASVGANIKPETLDAIDKIVASLPPPESPPQTPAPGSAGADRDEHDMVLENAAEAIGKALTDWNRDVFGILDRIPAQEFCADDIYQYEDELKLKYPNNNTVPDQIRKQLQNIRDFGLIRFDGRGHYTKLWT